MHLHVQEVKDTSERIDSIFSIVKTLIKQLARVKGKALSLMRKEVWILEAGAENVRNPPSVLFVGNYPEKHYVGKLFFKGNYICRSLGDYWVWQILFPNKTLRHTSSFCVIQTRWPTTNSVLLKKWFCLPTWVYGSVDLMDDFRKFALKSHSAKNTLKKIKKGNFKVEISSEPALFDEFYHKLHQPYMENRHGNSSAEESYNLMKAKFLDGGELLFVRCGSQRVAGCMLRYHEDRVTAYRLGVRDGDFSWVAKGAIGALYFHMLNYCRLQGFRKLNLGGCRPFLSDGVLNYKLRNWNMKIDDYSKHFYFLLKPLEMNPFTKAFLCNHPFVSLNRNQMVANSFFQNTDCLPGVNDKDSQRKRLAKKGLSNIALHSCSENSHNLIFGNQIHASH